MRAVFGVAVLVLALTAPQTAALAADPVPPLDVAVRTSAPAIDYGDSVTFSATVTQSGVPVAGATVVLHRIVTLPAGGISEGDVATVVTDAQGVAELSDLPELPSTYGLRATASPSMATGVSATVSVGVRWALPTAVSPLLVPPGGRLTLTGSVSPASSGGFVTLAERRPGGTLRFTAKVRPAADGRWTYDLGRRRPVGTYTFDVSGGGDLLVRGSGHAVVTATVTRTGAGPASAWSPTYGTKRKPMRWNTCRIGYRVNPRMMPAYGMSDLREAMRRVTQVSGIRFRYLGRTTQVPTKRWAGPGHNQVLVAWGTNKSLNGVLGQALGVGLTTPRRGRIDTGMVLIDARSRWNKVPGFGAGAPHGLTLMHELGHLVGLDHSTDKRQVMEPYSSLPAAVWGAGDQTGLRRLGSHCR